MFDSICSLVRWMLSVDAQIHSIFYLPGKRSWSSKTPKWLFCLTMSTFVKQCFDIKACCVYYAFVYSSMCIYSSAFILLNLTVFFILRVLRKSSIDIWLKCTVQIGPSLNSQLFVMQVSMHSARWHLTLQIHSFFMC